jgi:hypothetical protein
MKVELVIVVGSIASPKVTEMSPLTGTAKTGLVEATVAGTVSAVRPVVKFHTKLAASARPDRSLAPVVIVAVCAALTVRWAEGTKVAVVPA